MAFHHGRQNHPERFSSRMFNKSYYLKTFLSQIPLKAKYINNVITLKAENEQINLPNIQVRNRCTLVAIKWPDLSILSNTGAVDFPGFIWNRQKIKWPYLRLHTTHTLDFWYGKRYWQYLLLDQKSSAWVVCRRIYGHFIFWRFQMDPGKSTTPSNTLDVRLFYCVYSILFRGSFSLIFRLGVLVAIFGK